LYTKPAKIPVPTAAPITTGPAPEEEPVTADCKGATVVGTVTVVVVVEVSLSALTLILNPKFLKK
jgi:hypothetical protein